MIEIDFYAFKVPAQTFHDECVVWRCSCAFLNDSSSYSPAPNNASSFHSISYFQLSPSSPLSSGNGVRIKIDAAPPTDNTQQWEKQGLREDGAPPSLPSEREAKRLRSIYRRSSILDQVQSTPTTTIAAPWVRHRIVAFDYSCTVGILATCLLNDGVRPAFKYKALRTASLWYYYQLTRETDMVSSRPRRLLTFRKQRCPGGGMEEGRGREHSEICAPD